MLASLEWLGEFVSLNDLTGDDVARLLTLAGVEVEGVVEVGEQIAQVLVAEVVRIEEHPNADRLSIVEIDVAGKRVNVVCGADNFVEGDRVPFAPPGATLPNGTEIRSATVRGVTSSGMLCSADELGLQDESSGLLILPVHARSGSSVADALSVKDTILDIGLTPNRGDCLSMHGLGRELAAVTDRPLRRARCIPLESWPRSWKPREAAGIQVQVEDTRAWRYAVARIRNVKAVQSPSWLRRRLEAIGQRPINAIVDATNFLMFENGQPLHAFDADKLRGGRIHVRAATDGEAFVGLDGEHRRLQADDLVIADDERPVALAGVMGASNSEVSDETTDIVIECAAFEPSTVRRSSRRYGIHTESSHRFERFVDPNGVPEALGAALRLIVRLMDEMGIEAYAEPEGIDLSRVSVEPKNILFPKAAMNDHVGLKLDGERIESVLNALSMEVHDEDAEHWRVIVPTWRPDVTRTVDLVEEVIRVVGYDQIPSTLPRLRPGLLTERRSDKPPVEQRAQPVVPRARLGERERARDVLAALGFHEAVNLSMVSDAEITSITGNAPSFRLRNPLGEDTAAMRTTLLSGLLRNAATNLARGEERIALFEIGAVFSGSNTEGRHEPELLGIVLAGIHHFSWRGSDPKVSAFDLAAAVETLAQQLGRPLERSSRSDQLADAPPWLHPGVRAALLDADGNRLGFLGQVHPDLLDAWEIEADVFAAEFAFDDLLEKPRPLAAASDVPRFPASSRDVALLVDSEVTCEGLLDASGAWHHDWLESIRVFDVYEGEHIGKDRKSIALRLVFRKSDGSLTDSDVDTLEKSWLEHMRQALNAERR